MEITIQQMKKSLLLLNKLHRQKFRSYLVKTPSKLSDDELKKFFTLLFTKKEDHYIPKKTTRQLDIDESEFKKIFVKPTKTPKPRTPKPKTTKPKKETAIKRTVEKPQIKENDKQSMVVSTKLISPKGLVKEEIKEEPKKEEVKTLMKESTKPLVKREEDINKLKYEIDYYFEIYYRNSIYIEKLGMDTVDKFEKGKVLRAIKKIKELLIKLQKYNIKCEGLTCINNLKTYGELKELTHTERYNYLYKIFKDEKYFPTKERYTKIIIDALETRLYIFFEKYYRISKQNIILNNKLKNNIIINDTVDKINKIINELKKVYNIKYDDFKFIDNLKNAEELNKLTPDENYKYLYKIFGDGKQFQIKLF